MMCLGLVGADGDHLGFSKSTGLKLVEMGSPQESTIRGPDSMPGPPLRNSFPDIPAERIPCFETVSKNMCRVRETW
jgi:hypothetical protein